MLLFRFYNCKIHYQIQAFYSGLVLRKSIVNQSNNGASIFYLGFLSGAKIEILSPHS
jgi:hypothetical protein